MKNLTLGSLFDGSGGFPLGAVLHGITPLWASEIEPFAVRVTTKRFPDMLHLGDVSRINGGAVPPVDIISFGSPCTDLSVAGKRRGIIEGKQSSLFYEAIRIIREMRAATNGQSPRFLIFENVQGAFNSNRGADFGAILDAVVGIAEPGAKVPAADKGGWPYADILVGDGWSVAYRLIDAQFFGLAQRRKRLYLVADFDSERADEILFERAGVPRDFAPGFGPWQETPGNPAGGARKASGTDYLTGWDAQRNRVFSAEGISPVLDGSDGGGGRNPGGFVLAHPPIAFACNQRDEVRELNDVAGAVQAQAGMKQQTFVAAFMAGQSAEARSIAYSESVSPTLKGGPGGLNQTPCAMVYDARGNGDGYIANTLTGDHNGHISDYTALAVEPVTLKIRSGKEGGGKGAMLTCNLSATLSAGSDQTLFAPAVSPGYTVRRLTPQECALLQGFPPDYCAGLETPEPTEADIAYWSEIFETHRRIIGKSSKAKTRNQIVKWLQNPHSDGAEYRLWGNGVALPCVCFVMAGIREVADD
jgi:DNA (cytosine-5)-methyltransferase 1